MKAFTIKAWRLTTLLALSTGILALSACGSVSGSKIIKRNPEPVTAAVIPFQGDTGGTATEIFQTEALRLPYSLIERSRLGEVMKEQGLAQSGALLSESATQIGNLLGAKKIITGRVIEWRDSTFKVIPPAFASISVKCIDTESGQIDWTAESEWRWDAWAWAGAYVTFGVSALFAKDGQGAMKAVARAVIADILGTKHWFSLEPIS